MADNFDLDKKNTLNKEDKSNKGHWDKRIIPLCDTINSKPDFYTSSSCAGRLVLFKIPDSGNKQETEWIFTTHELMELEEMMPALKDLPDNHMVFRYEPFIIHVVCRNMEAADRLLRLVRDMGLKRCGIISLGKKIVIEIIGTANISTLVARQGRLLLDIAYLKVMTETANMLLEGNWQLIGMIEKKIKSQL
ncbi:TPA: hypothetical protein HA265_00650 [Candidatus Woesearchaeota archaeon]|nr:hypothetical protein [Candidatus Woesearchaeota archaeon]